MNRIHRKIWSRSLGAFIAVAETTRSRGKAGGGGGGVCGYVGGAWVAATVLLGQALASGWAHAGPQGGQLAAGSGSIAQAGTGTGNNTVTTITQTSPRMVIHWNSFNIGAGESVSFRQPDASAIALNRVLGSGASQIDGSLTANGQVWLLNPSGVLFGRNAQVSGGGLLTSTLGLSDASFMAGQYRFSADGSQGSVVNQGSLTGGYVALLGKQVVNSGSIVATGSGTGTAQTGGAAMLGAGDAMTLNFDGQRLLNLQVDRGSYQALVDNQGLVQADDGQVRLTAHAKDALLATVVNNSGIVQARGVRSHGGTIELLGGFNGGTVQVGGTLDASSARQDGGFIDTSGARVQVQDGARVSTLAPQGRSGTWLIDPDDFTVSAGSGSQTGSGIGADTLAANLASTSVTLQTNSAGSSGNGDILVNAPVSWNAATRLTLRADRDIAINADITAQHSSGHLVLEYGGAAPSAGNLAQFRLAPGVKVNLQAGNNFSTRLGNDSPVVTWRVITQLGAAGSTTGTDLQGINGDLTGRYVLGGDIDASATAAWNNGEGFAPLGDATTPFTGRLDGLGRSISGLTINRPTTDHVGLIGYAAGATTRNLTLLNGSVSGRDQVGALVGYNSAGSSVYDSHASSSVLGRDDVGGLVGYNAYSNVNHSSATGSVLGRDNVGGLAGTTNNSSETDNHATARVTGRNNVGGLEGLCYACTLSYSHATGHVTGNDNVGGLVGTLYSAAPAFYNYATGNVTGSHAVGGLVGSSAYGGGAIGYSYATGRVTGGTDVGGLVGVNVAWLESSNWDSLATGQSSAVGSDSGFIYDVTDVSAAPYTRTSYGRLGAWAQQGSTAVWVANGGGNTPLWVMIEGQTRPFLYNEYSTTIRNVHQLQLMATNLGASYSLANNIDASDTNGSNPSGMWSSSGFVPVGNSSNSFTGRFDGLGHTISDLTINRPSIDNVGLIGFASGATVQNLGLLAARVTGDGNVGHLAAYLDSNAVVINTYTAGGTVMGNAYVGGLVGKATTGSVSNSYATANVIGAQRVGGLMGGTGGTVSNSYATGTVTATGAEAGGLVGYLGSAGAVSYSYATGNVFGIDAVGGLVGDAEVGGVNRSYATGRVSLTPSLFMAPTAGGLVGRIADPINYSGVLNSTFDAESTGRTVAIGNMPLLTEQTISIVGATNRYFSTSYNDLGAWTTSNGIATATDSNTTPRWVMIEGQTRPFLYNEYSTTIRNAHQLQLMATNLRASYSLANNIDASDTNGSNPSGMWSTAGYVPVGDNRNHFTGQLDGLSHTISGLTINRSNTDNVGLVGKASAATIRNIGLHEANVTGRGYVGGLVGNNDNNNSIANSFVDGQIVGVGWVGGLVGANNYVSSITNSYATASVSGASLYIGGLVGSNHWSSTISNSYASGSVVGGGYIGGLVGANDASTVNNSYWNITSSGRNSSADGTGLTTAQMQQASSFSGWSIDRYGDNNSAVWRIYEGSTAPLLRSFMTPLTVTQTGAQTSRDYNGLTAVTGASYAYSIAPDSRLLGAAGVSSVSKDVGTRNTYVSGLYATQSGYDIRQTAGSVTITPKLVTLTALSLSKTYDGGLGYTATPADLTALSSQLGVVGDALSAAQMAYTGSANAGTGNRTAALNGVTIADGNGGNNYSVTLVGNSSSTIDQAPLTVTASADGRQYNGQAYSGGSGVVYSGWVNNESASVLSGTLGYSGNAQGATHAGSYTITPGGLTSGNYAITFANGNLVISPKTVTLTAPVLTKVYDGGLGYTATPADLTALSSQLGVVGDAVSAAQMAYTGSANAGTGNRTAVLNGVTIADGNGGNNYSVTLVGNSSSTIDQAPLTVTSSLDGRAALDDVLGALHGSGGRASLAAVKPLMALEDVLTIAPGTDATPMATSAP